MSNFCGPGKAAFTSSKDDWETPQALFDKLDAEWHFTLDAAASDENAKCGRYFTIEDDGLAQPWTGVVFCNPPYGRHIGAWVKKARSEAEAGNATVVMLIPARTDTAYWHDCIFGHADIQFLRGRLKFERAGASTNSAPFPSAIVVFKSSQATR